MEKRSERKGLIPIYEGLWETVDKETYLVASQCNICGEIFFPRKKNGFCSHCQRQALQDITLSKVGKIRTFTVVYQQPAGGYYKGRVPFAYGIVEMPEGVNVQTLFTCPDYAMLGVGVQARLVIESLYEQDDGLEVVTYKFTPVSC